MNTEGQYYFMHPVTNETSYGRPSSWLTPRSEERAWVQLVGYDEEGSPYPYWYNELSGEMRYDEPSDQEDDPERKVMELKEEMKVKRKEDESMLSKEERRARRKARRELRKKRREERRLKREQRRKEKLAQAMKERGLLPKEIGFLPQLHLETLADEADLRAAGARVSQSTNMDLIDHHDKRLLPQIGKPPPAAIPENSSEEDNSDSDDSSVEEVKREDLKLEPIDRRWSDRRDGSGRSRGSSRG